MAPSQNTTPSIELADLSDTSNSTMKLSASSSTLSSASRLPTEEDGETACSDAITTADESETSAESSLPYHVYTPRMIWTIVFVISIVAMPSGLSSNMYQPAQEDISKALDITPLTVMLSIATYMSSQGIAPSIWGPLADRLGRRQTLIYTLLLYVAASIALAMTRNSAMLLVFRALQAAGSSSTISIGSAIIADIVSPDQRGTYAGLFQGARQSSIAFGPLLGGAFADSMGWRSIFWSHVIYGSFSVLLVILVLPETLRRNAGNGSTIPRSWYHRAVLQSLMFQNKVGRDEEAATIQASQEMLRDLAPITLRTFLEPFRYLVQRDVFCELVFGGLNYTAWSMMTASTTSLLKDKFGLSTTLVGCFFLANGIACAAGSYLTGPRLDQEFKVQTKLWQQENGKPVGAPLAKPRPTSFPLERARLFGGLRSSCEMIVALLIFGWSLSSISSDSGQTSQLFVPLIAQFIAGWSATLVMQSNTMIMTDLFPGKTASAVSLQNFMRCLPAAGGVAASAPLLNRVGPGWWCFVLAGLVLLSLPFYWLAIRYGQSWRAVREHRKDSD